MSEEEMNKKMEFIIEQQAKFAADIEIAREVQAADARRLSNGLLGLVDIVGNLTRAHIETDQSINRLTEAGERTDARLNILINVVNRHISGNGGSHNHAQ
jgi:hypothetical protein